MRVKLFEEFTHINNDDTKSIFCTCGKVIDGVTQDELDQLEDMGYVFLGGENEYTFEEKDYDTIMRILGKYPEDRETYPEF